ncbi:MAG: hypothetical protein R3311_20225, partial [Oceanisphaera sp.]|nr:hypothetical protein [Oceanisphaera sp.]
MARSIQARLTKACTPETVFVIRRILPWLPSFDSAFSCAEPLTRIRDIAHRNDIPRELKQEIKHSLQNKLHRCAGPEDLEVAADLLSRITSSKAEYSPEFVEQFKQFYEELKEFFNARTLDEQLEAVREWSCCAADTPGPEELPGECFSRRLSRLIPAFLEARQSARTPAELQTVFKLATTLRENLCTPYPGCPAPELQKLQIAEIRLEDYVFTLLSSLINSFAGSPDSFPWHAALACLQMTIRNLRLSGFNQEECRAAEAELRAWSRKFDYHDRNQLLRIKATLDRCRRLGEEH